MLLASAINYQLALLGALRGLVLRHGLQVERSRLVTEGRPRRFYRTLPAVAHLNLEMAIDRVGLSTGACMDLRRVLQLSFVLHVRLEPAKLLHLLRRPRASHHHYVGFLVAHSAILAGGTASSRRCRARHVRTIGVEGRLDVSLRRLLPLARIRGATSGPT